MADLTDLKIMGPEVSKRNKTVSYSLKIPHQSINEDPTSHEQYLAYHERAVKEIFDALPIHLSEPVENSYAAIPQEVQTLPAAQLKSPE